jgi:phage terminase large subunit-like protein
MGVGREVRGIGAFAGSRIKVLPADPRTADGVRPTLAILDELHRHPTSELYSILRDGLVARGGRMLSISTAGEFENPDADDPHSDPLARLRLSARALLLERPFPEWRYVTARSEAFAYHEWALWPGDDPADMALVKACNPSSWTTEENLRQQYESQSMLDWQWQRFRCGLWVGGSEDSVFSSVDWNACADPAIQIPRGARVYVGVDLARIHDTCALVPVWQDTPGHVVTCDSIVLRPPGDGSQIPISEVVPHIIKMREKWDVEIVFDPNAGGGLIAEELSRYDIFANELPQSPANLAAASELLRSLIVERRLTHDGDPTVTSHILSSVQKSVGAEGWRIAKPARGGRHVDAAQALSWAAYVALAPPPADPFMFTI